MKLENKHTMLDWLIIGGGPIGTTIANYLVNAYGVPRARLRVLDPHPEPLARWNRLTRNTGMRFLRSPHVHHIDCDHLSLRDFAKSEEASTLGGHILPYNRPAYRLFQAHTARTIEQRGLADLFVQGTAEFIMSTKGGLRVDTTNGALRARQVVLALGRTALHVPSWARDLPAARHIFSTDFKLDAVPVGQHVVVIGGGITAGQVALHLAAQHPGQVTLLMRHPLAVADFDSSPCWLGPSCKGVFQRAGTPAERRVLIAEARNRGTMSSDVARDVRKAVKAGILHLRQDDVTHAAGDVHRATLTLASGDTLTADSVLLATGFDLARPGGAWLDEVIDWFGLPLAECGYPIVDENLCWHPGLYVSGALAELELGPPAANIVGGRLAAERLQSLASR